MNRNLFAAAALAAAVALSGSAEAQRLKVGTLECYSPGSTSFIIGSITQFDCRFTPADRGPIEYYTGTVRRIGLDIGFTAETRLAWLVTAATPYRRGVLAGAYVGVSAGAAVGIGLGANALIGGFGDSIGLQPISVQAERGASLALTVSGLELRPAR
jgi:hypothetical protein